MPTYDVFVTWLECVGHNHIVEANSKEEAEEMALRECERGISCPPGQHFVEVAGEYRADAVLQSELESGH